MLADHVASHPRAEYRDEPTGLTGYFVGGPADGRTLRLGDEREVILADDEPTLFLGTAGAYVLSGYVDERYEYRWEPA